MGSCLATCMRYRASGAVGPARSFRRANTVGRLMCVCVCDAGIRGSSMQMAVLFTTFAGLCKATLSLCIAQNWTMLLSRDVPDLARLVQVVYVRARRNISIQCCCPEPSPRKDGSMTVNVFFRLSL